MLRNVIYISLSIILFFAGTLIYGIILNINELTLEESMKKKGIEKIDDPYLIVDRKNYFVELYSGDIQIKKYRAAFGKNRSSIKTSPHDFVTPVGEFKICDKTDSTKYYKKLILNYPTIKDAAEGLKKNLITQAEFYKIKTAQEYGECPPFDTQLGGNISIHGLGKFNIVLKNLPFVFNWTNGSIAISNEGMDELFSVMQIGNDVKIIN